MRNSRTVLKSERKNGSAREREVTKIIGGRKKRKRDKERAVEGGGRRSSHAT